MTGVIGNAGLALTVGTLLLSGRLAADDLPSSLATGTFSWQASKPIFAPLQRAEDELYSVKDPTIVRHEGRWHLFVTVRGRDRSHQIEHLSFADWDRPDDVKRSLLTMHDGFYCAPQVFYFRPHQKWYLVCQASDESWEPNYGAAYSTSDDVSDPRSWSPLKPMGHLSADGKRGLDFWVICDKERAHLFFTSLDGRMWREETSLDEFPTGWSEPHLALKGDVFEASHTYRIRGGQQYLTIIEAQHAQRHTEGKPVDGQHQPRRTAPRRQRRTPGGRRRESADGLSGCDRCGSSWKEVRRHPMAAGAA